MKQKSILFPLILLLILLTAAVPLRRPGPIAITFDDGPSSKYTPYLLDELERRGVHATFFVMGNSLTDQHGDIVEKNAAIVRRAAEAGHQIGNHSYSHPKLSDCSDSTVLDELEKTDQALQKILGSGTYMVRPPYGSDGLTPRVRALISRPVILWSIDPAWETGTAAEDDMYRCIVDSVRDGDIILLHDFQGLNNIDAALRAIDTLQARGFSFVTVAELMELKGVAPEPGTVYRRFPRPPA